ncbi:MAG: heme exporter protein CcmD [Xanthobacteraceae bacterium]|nr:MAG: heme exporter protein CcmD [Xanthobacteraceae bacterium]
MNLGQHAGFIVAAYGVAVIVVTALIGWIAADYRRQTRTLRRLEASGITRRSAAIAPAAGTAPSRAAP